VPGQRGGLAPKTSALSVELRGQSCACGWQYTSHDTRLHSRLGTASVPFRRPWFWNNGRARLLRLPCNDDRETGLRMNLEKMGTIVLLVATMLVAISILVDGTASRLFNGAAGLAWFSAIGLLGTAAWRASRRWNLWLAAVVLTGLVAFVVTPSDFMPAMIGFGLAGTAIAIVARDNAVLWSKLVVGLYLPFHIGTAVARAIYRGATGGEATLRTDPPPTAALVPFVMLVAAVACATAAKAYLDRRRPARFETNRVLHNS